MRIGLALIFVIVFYVKPAIGIPVDHNAQDGIAAVAANVQVDFRTNNPFFALVLGVDGELYKLEGTGKLVHYSLPYGLETEWPVDFLTVTDWTPLMAGLPGSDDPFVHHGMLKTADGTRWVLSMRVLGGWDSGGSQEIELKWIKFSLISK